jgi:2-oxoglutarate ferredoxin oxidoreductase subunit alpha
MEEEKSFKDTDVKENVNGGSTPIVPIDDVTIRFAGDSGDGMQLTGAQFSDTVAASGLDVGTLPDYPAEIRAPLGTLYGVSGYQIHFSTHEVHTPGDSIDVLVAMNPAALKVNIKDLKKRGIIIANADAFDKKNLELAKYETNPLEDDSLQNYEVYAIPITKTTVSALKDLNLSMKVVVKCKNFFALGVVYWLYNKAPDNTLNWIHDKFQKSPDLIEANSRALKAGYYYGETTEIFTNRFDIKPSTILPKGLYRNINGNDAVALGLVAAAANSGLQLFLGSYPITPASEILHALSKYKKYGVKTFQAEDEIAGICTSIGASFAGCLSATTTSGPGMSLKTEAIGLAVISELPLVIVNVQRGGPSTGLPTKTEQADLLQAVYGRNGECPVPVLAATSPSDCFTMTYEAARIAIKYMTPVIVLTDGYIANGSEPWRIQKLADLPKINVTFRTNPEGFYPYLRDEFLARPWVKPGTKGLEHRIGGLEKQNITGNVSYDPENHQIMTKIRAKKIKNIEMDIPELQVDGDQSGELIVLGWGSTCGAIADAVENVRAKGRKVSFAHLKYLFPFPKNTGNVLKKFNKILIPEGNTGQLSKLIKSEYLLDTIIYSKVKGAPLKSPEIESKIEETLLKNN